VSGNEQNRYALEHLWKTRTEDAKARLDRAAESLKELSEDSETILPGDSDRHDNAIRVYTEALREYANISKIYQDLVLHGTVPDEEHRCRKRSMHAGYANYQ
jgi:hypothetical protein